MKSPSQVTQILSQIQQGDPSAAERLLPLVYEELRKLAAANLSHETPGQTLQATALVHEAYIRLVDRDNAQHWNGRGHFFAAAAEAMRRILINHARDKATAKRGVNWRRVSLDAIATPDAIDPSELVAIDDLLARLIESDAQTGEIAKLRIFAGLTIPQIAQVLDLGRRTVDRRWAFARAWLQTQLASDEASP